MALQYWQNVGKPGKDRFLCFTNGYHGDTFGAMAVSDPEKSMHKALARRPGAATRGGYSRRRTLTRRARLDARARFTRAGGDDHRALGARRRGHAVPRCRRSWPPCTRWQESTASCSSPTKSPPASGAPGEHLPARRRGSALTSSAWAKHSRAGRSAWGRHWRVRRSSQSFLSDDWETALMHGPTFMANPLACAAANASLDLFEREPREEQVKAIEAGLRSGLEPCRVAAPRGGRASQRGDRRGAARSERRRLFVAAPIRGTGRVGTAVQGYRLPHAAACDQRRGAERADSGGVRGGQRDRDDGRRPFRSAALKARLDHRVTSNGCASWQPEGRFQTCINLRHERGSKSADCCEDVLLIDCVEITALH